MTVQPDSLITIAMLVSLRISTWSARKYDKRVTRETNEREHAAANASRVNKHLLAGVASHANLLQLASKARLTYYGQTLPWTDEGWRILPTANYTQFTQTVRQAISEFDAAVSTWSRDEYPYLYQQMQATLGNMWDAAEYPDPKDVRSKFRMSVEYDAIKTGNDIRVNLPADQVALIERSVTDRLQSAMSVAMQDAWSRLYEAVDRLRNAAQPDGRVFTSTVENVQTTIDLLRRLNIADDPNLEAMRVRVETAFAGLEAQDLRDSDRMREHVARSAQSIVDSMSAFYTPQAAEVVR